MILKVRDKDTGKVYTNDMSDDNLLSILAIHFCTSYTQVEVQETVEGDGKDTFPSHSIIIPPLGSNVNVIDLIATQNDPKGEWVQ